jgi:undecaprenyl-diphosphatase
LTLLQAILIAIVEGITEFLPISSTGHMIIVQHLLGVENSDFVKAYTINIQFGAILSVVVLYFKRFLQSFDFYFKLFVGFIPAAIIGFALNDWIDALLESVTVVAISLFIGGILLLFVDRWFRDNRGSSISYRSSFIIGLFQCIAMIPGVSRSAATIIGGMAQGMTRSQAAEFSFFLAVPTMFGASAYKLLKGYKAHPEIFEGDHLPILLVGNAVAFVVALCAIRFFIGYLNRKGFRVFGWYRIALGVILLSLLASGIPLEIS